MCSKYTRMNLFFLFRLKSIQTFKVHFSSLLRLMSWHYPNLAGFLLLLRQTNFLQCTILPEIVACFGEHVTTLTSLSEYYLYLYLTVVQIRIIMNIRCSYFIQIILLSVILLVKNPGWLLVPNEWV